MHDQQDVTYDSFNFDDSGKYIPRIINFVYINQAAGCGGVRGVHGVRGVRGRGARLEGAR